jgi:hypothetical protein
MTIMRFCAAFAAAMSLLLAPPAQANAACPADANVGSPIRYNVLESDVFLGLTLSFLFGLTPATFPKAEIEERPNACSRGSFESGGDTYNVFGEEGDTPPRWAVSEGSRKIAFLAWAPLPSAALSAYRGGAIQLGQNSFDDAIVVLAVTDGSKRNIYEIYDDVPGDAQLLAAMKGALDGTLPLLAVYHVRRQELTTERALLPNP